MLVVIQNTDHIMLTMMIGESENGYYTAAITCATLAQFVFTAITDSFRPMILLHKKEDELAYKKDEPLLICGSFYLLAEVKSLLQTL